MTLFSVNDISKTFDKEILFEKLAFGMEQGDRVGLIGRNGIGKSTFIRIIAGLEAPDTGEVVFNKNVTYKFLDQNPLFLSEERVIDEVMSAKAELFELIETHHRLCNELNIKFDPAKSKRLEEIVQIIDNHGAWNLENKAKAILSSLGIIDFDQKCNTLSGGQRKRVALAQCLVSDPDLLIMDEPTNHLDADSVQWLQDKLQSTGKSILFITHDRYFLDAVSTRIVEIDRQKIFNYEGSYEEYLVKKSAFVEAHNATAEHTKNKLVRELAWLAKGAKARRTKQKSRIDWISKMTAETDRIDEKKIKIELGKTFLGNRVIDANYISKSIAGKLLFKEFTYNAKPGDRLGFIGPNGCGKTTLLNVLAGKIRHDSGELKIGETVNIGFYSQELDNLDENKTLIASLREVAEYIDCGAGRDRYLTAKDLLTKFLFRSDQHNALVATLSGGERRRLALLKVLMTNPNVLILDEPTNDLDIQTLNVLEEYLEDFYGVLLVVSHDRAFLDRTIHFILAFEGNGKIKEYPGNYSFYLEKKESKSSQASKAPDKAPTDTRKSQVKVQKKLSYNEQRELDTIEELINNLEDSASAKQKEIDSSSTDYKLQEKLYVELENINKLIEEKTNRWLELQEKKEELERN